MYLNETTQLIHINPQKRRVVSWEFYLGQEQVGKKAK